jgi:5-methyltetrahydropteroyltriglutamate--homocysteine methyltransferase
MPNRKDPPFRAEHLGSLARPQKLVEAREAWRDGKLDRKALTEIENACVREAVSLQERTGIQVISDGEFRRWSWRDILFDCADGYSRDRKQSDFIFTLLDGTRVPGRPVPDVTGRLKLREPMSSGFPFVKKLTSKTVKATLPVPSVNHFFRGDKMLQGSPYKDRDEYLADVAKLYREELAWLVREGCEYLQLDDVPSALLCDERNKERLRARGEDPEKTFDQYVRLFNDSVRDWPADRVLGVHLCRGNVGHGQASGGYEPVAEKLFNLDKVRVYFLEYDSDRAGGFEPLRHLPKDRHVVLGLMSTKDARVESADELQRRVEQALKFVDLDRLAISPQCGFSSNYKDARFGESLEEQKLRRLVETAQKIWG